MNWIVMGFGLLILIFLKLTLLFIPMPMFGINYHYVLGFITGFYFVGFTWELTIAGYLPINKAKGGES